MRVGNETESYTFCTHCEELEWQCQCPPEPDEIINPTPDDYYDDPMNDPSYASYDPNDKEWR